jgi:hypothetical protein
MNMGLAIALGAAIGAGLGVAMKDMALGTAIGMGAGITLGALTRLKGGDDDDPSGGR